MSGQVKNLDQVGEDILLACRNELYLNLPYLDVVLCGLEFRAGKEMTLSLATDGQVLHYNGNFLAERYLRGRVLCNRAYLHVLLHCMLRHLAKKRERVPELWDLACDAAVESILDELQYPCLELGFVPAKQKFYGECRAEMPVLTAEGIYRYLQKQNYSEYQLAQLQRVFVVDDHGLWAPPEKEDRQRSQRQDEQWRDRSEKTRTAMETVLAGQAAGGQAVLEQVKVATREDVDYRAFLRRFAVPREVMAVDDDTFDYGFYSYGLRLYGNVPLVEPTETREEKRIEDLVIAIDTSMSTSGEQVRKFLESTYSILRSSETFTRRFNIRILQCDDRLRRDDTVRDLRELKEYMEDFKLVGGSSTDFRPVFDYVEKLRAEGQFTQLRGLIYFTDGMGTYPKLPTPYETAFIMLQPSPIAIEFPPWAIRLILGEAALERAWEDVSDAVEYLTELPEL